jgi:hypothetical protein
MFVRRHAALCPRRARLGSARQSSATDEPLTCLHTRAQKMDEWIPKGLLADRVVCGAGPRVTTTRALIG